MRDGQSRVYDGWRELEEIVSPLNGTHKDRQAFVWGAGLDELLCYAKKVGSTWTKRFAFQDRMSSTHKLVDAAGVVVEEYVYDPYGEPTVTTLSGLATDNPYLWTGRRYDPETGWYYFRNRYYSPALGRFVTEDPLGVWGDTAHFGNPYAYAGNSPFGLFDPLGLQTGGGGHHWVPKSVWNGPNRVGDFSPAVKGVFDRVSGPISGRHGWDKAHARYNKAAAKEMKAWLKRLKTSPSKVTVRQAERFAKFMETGKSAAGRVNPTIKRFNDRIRDNLTKRAKRRAAKLAARKSAACLGKKGLKTAAKKIVAPAAFLYLWATTGIDNAIHDAFWPASEMLNGPSDYELAEIEGELDAELPVFPGSSSE